MSVARHTGYNLLGAAVPILVSLATVPLYLELIGLERFGVLSVCWLLLGYFGLFDLGLNRAMSQRIAMLGQASPQARSLVFWTGLWLSVALAAAAALIMVPVAYYGLHHMRFDSAQVAAEVSAAIPWLAAAVPVALLSGIFTGSLMGRERFGLINLAEGLSTSLTSVLPLVMAWWIGPDLWVLVASALAARLLLALLLLVASIRAIPVLAPTRPDAALARALLGYGGWVSVSGIIAPLLAFWDRFAIGWMISAAAVSIYVVPFTLVWRLAIVPGALAKAMFPRFAAQSGDSVERLQLEGLAALSFIMTPSIVAAILLVHPFLDLWVGSAVAREAAPIAYILLPAIWINGFAQIVYTRLQGVGRPDTVAKIHLAEIVPYVAALWAGIHFLGLAGAALVWTLRVAVDTVLLFRAADPGLGSLRRLLPEAMLVVLAAVLALALPRDTLWHWLAILAILPLATFTAYRGLPEAAKLFIRSILNKAGLRAA